jgi:putative nucleotidyltransferase with HDIG domain
LGALRTIDMAISGSLNLKLTLGIIVDQVTASLEPDAVSVLMLDQHTYILEYAHGDGFRGQGISHSRVPLGNGPAGTAALEQRTVCACAPLFDEDRDARRELLDDESFESHIVTPLIVKGQTKGVLEVFHRRPFVPDDDWTGFLEALALQTAIALDSATMFEELERSNIELCQAYDATIEGWSRALDLRDKETEGHTQRVTEITMRLARAMGIDGAEAVHIRRGALLHDIGKMGVPDSILHKPGPLSDPEWTVMSQHPQLAFEMLAPIAHLRPALDIPTCHHEKWDGTGYPRGMKGEQIPLAARVFAVVDVWDALCSDRPYRAAWSEKDARAHILTSSGTHFDPKVVDAFIRLLDEG